MAKTTAVPSRITQRMIQTGRAVACVGALAALAACQDVGFMVGTPPDSFEVGDNLVGESCRAEAMGGDLSLAVEGLSGERYGVFCGDWEQPSAQMIVTAAAVDDIGRALEIGPWRSRIDLLAVCETPKQTTIVDDIPAAVLDCRLRDGGWPYIAFVTVVEGSLYMVHGIPAAQPVAESAIAVLAGLRAPGSAPAGSSAAVARLEELLKGRMFGSGDLQHYQALLKIGGYYNGRKSFAEAETRYRDALEIHQRILGAGDPEYSDPLMHLAVEVSNQERFTVADQLFLEAGALVGRTAEPADKARYVSYLALHHANQRDYDKALAFARQATDMRREIAAEVMAPASDGSQPNIFAEAVDNLGASSVVLQSSANVAALDLAQSLATEAAMLLRTGQPEEAQEVVREALKVVEASVHVPEFWHPQILELSAQVSRDLGNTEAARQQVDAALEQRRAVAPETRTVALGEFLLADILALKGNSQQAVEAYDRGLEIFRANGESLRPFQIMSYLDLLWSEGGGGSLVTGAVAAQMFDGAQLVRGAVAAQNISQATARLSASDQEAGQVIRRLQDAVRDRDNALFRFNAAAGRAVTQEERLALDELRAEVTALEDEISRLEPQVQAAAPNLNILSDVPSQSADLVPLLRADEALVQFVIGDDHGYSFLVTPAGVQVARVEVSKPVLAKAVNSLREAFIVRRTAAGAEIAPYDARLANLLYQRLMGPFDPALAAVDHLVTVPSGPLLSLPLGLLVRSEPPEVKASDYSAVDFLIKDMAVSLSPSVRAFVDLRSKARRSQAPRRFLGMGDFVPSGDADAILQTRGLPEACRAGAEAVAFAPRLSETKDQILAMAASFGAPPEEMVLGEAFTEARISELELDQYRVLVFATHGLLPGELDCLAEPALLVSRSDSAAQESDGLLTYSDIFELELDADVVVLSACNTGGPLSQSGLDTIDVAPLPAVGLGESDRVRGESLAGLARAFFYAGARSLLVSNWEVYTEATVRLMTETFAMLQDSEEADLAESLRQAKLGFLADPATSHPYLWGAFALIGDGAPPKHDSIPQDDSPEGQVIQQSQSRL